MVYVRVVALVVVVVTLVGLGWCQEDTVLPVPRRVDPLQKALQTSSNISKVEAMLPRLGSTHRASATLDQEMLEVNNTQQMNALSAIEMCNRTFALDDGQAALLYSRSDLWRYTCRQAFRAVNRDSKLEFACQVLNLKFNCFLEALKVTVDGEEEIYCSNDVISTRKGKEVEVEYTRKIGGINGMYVCTVTAELTLPNRLTEPSCMACGVTSSMDQEKREGEAPPVLRVVGGRDASEAEYPWMAFLIMQSENGRFSCGGTLITNTLVLTAAHCLAGEDENTVTKIEIGLNAVHRYVGVSQTSPWHWYYSTNFKIHPEYDEYNIHNDAAMVILDSPITFTDNIRPACLPAADRNLEGATLTATGWGLMAYEGAGAVQATVLQEVELTAWTNAECQDVWRGLIEGHILLNSQLCASRPGKDTCSGDSGGPLLLKADGRWTVVGITSYGYKCAVRGKPGVYTRVSKYLSWINSFIPDDYCGESEEQ